LRPRILFFVPADYDALRRKGVDRGILERDEGGFFERVVTIHPLAGSKRTIDLGAVHRIYEYPLGRGLGSEPAGVGRRLFALIRLIPLFRDVVAIARVERIDLVRATDPYLMGLLAWWTSRSLGIPFCVSLHADYDKRFALSPKRGASRWLRRLARMIPSFVVPKADMLLPIRGHMVGWMKAAGAAPQDIRLIPHGVDLTAFAAPVSPDARAQFEIPDGATVVSFVGRLAADNYISDVVNVIELLLRRRRDVVFVLIGEGPAEGMVRRRLLDQPELAAAVRLLPFQPYERVVALRQLSAASLCLMGGFSLIEACAAGSVPIAYDVEWHRDLVKDGITGFLLREHDIDGVITALEQVIANPQRAVGMGLQARRAAFEQHDLRATSKIKQACYAEMLDRRRASVRKLGEM
jgi:glycosyltransferase involved in cell wall biosynthesis